MAVFPEEAFAFYEGLRADNSKTYWNTHKQVYESAVREPMRELLESLALAYGADVVVYRPYRDVRFSKDKSPYKTAQSGMLEMAAGVGYYLQVDADAVAVGGGFHARSREQTSRYRAAVDNDLTGRRLASLTAKLARAGFEIGGRHVRTRPRGVSPDHPRLELMRLEHLIATQRLDPARVTPAVVRTHWKSLQPLIRWVLDNAGPV